MTNSKRNALLALWAIITTLAIAEIALSILDIPHFYKKHTAPPQFRFFSEVEKYQDIGYLNKPSTTIRYIYDGNPRGYFGPENEVDHTINSMGFRSRQSLPAHISTTFRVVVLGDSFTFGEGVRDEDTFTMQLEQILLEKFPELDIQALNFGVGGYNTVQAAEMLRLFGAKVQPDLIVLGYTTNDAHPMLYAPDLDKNNFVRRSTPLMKLGRRPTSPPPESFLYANSRIAQLVWLVSSKWRKSDELIDVYRAMYAEDNADWKKTKQAMEKISGICTQLAVPCYSVMFPIMYNFEEYPLQKEHEQIREALTDNDFEVIDLLPSLIKLNIPYTDLWVHPTDHHPNEIVHKMVAELLFQRIANSNLLEKYTSESDR